MFESKNCAYERVRASAMKRRYQGTDSRIADVFTVARMCQLCY